MNLSFLRPLYDHPLIDRAGPWASVYLDSSRDTEDATARIALLWRAARDGLRSAGADESTLDVLERTVLEQSHRPGRHGVAAFAAGGTVAYTEAMAAPPDREIVAFESLPHAMPLVAQRGERIAWLRVVVDRTGADIVGATEGGLPRARHVEGSEDYPLRKAKPGGWSQPRYQRAAELTWQRNAEEVAEAVTDLADAIGADVLVVAGDVHARPLLVDRLPKRWRMRVVESDVGSRAPGADPEPLDDLTARAVAELASATAMEALDRFGTQRGQDPDAGNGLAAVVAALQRAQVDTGLLVHDPSAAHELWIGPQATEIAATAGELRAMGVENPQRVRADAALLRALAGTDADLVLVTQDAAPLHGGIGAVLRYVDARRGQ